MFLLEFLAASQAWTDTIGVGFTFLILMPALATVLIVVAIVSARGEKRDNEKHAGRWGRAAQRRSTGDG
jgi:NADH:ubiquinone oxidoreductase subunit K